MLTGEGLRELFVDTRLRLGDVVPNRTRLLKSVPSTSLLYHSDSPSHGDQSRFLRIGSH